MVEAAKECDKVKARSEIERMMKENLKLQQQVELLENSQTLVDWYVQFMESGKDAKELFIEHAKLEKKHALLQEKHKTVLLDFQQQIKELNEKNGELRATIKKQQETVVKPLI